MSLTKYNNYSVASGTVPKATEINPDIQIIGKGGSNTNTWSFQGAFVKSVNFGDMEYSADDFATVEMTISVDYASINGSGETGNDPAGLDTTGQFGESLPDEENAEDFPGESLL